MWFDLVTEPTESRARAIRGVHVLRGDAAAGTAAAAAAGTAATAATAAAAVAAAAAVGPVSAGGVSAGGGEGGTMGAFSARGSLGVANVRVWIV